MFVFTTHGFFSIVQHKDNPEHLMVKARVKGDIERYFPGAVVQRTEDADYLYRTAIHRAQVADAVMGMVDTIDYPSFKAALKDKSRLPYHFRVLDAMIDMQNDKQTEEILYETLTKG